MDIYKVKRKIPVVLGFVFCIYIFSGCFDNTKNYPKKGTLNDVLNLSEDIEKSKYKRITDSIEEIKISHFEPDNIVKLTDESYIYIGRMTCAACREFIFKLNEEKIKLIKIYYLDTDKLTDDEKKKLTYIGVKQVPTIIKINGSKFDYISIDDFERGLVND